MKPGEVLDAEAADTYRAAIATARDVNTVIHAAAIVDAAWQALKTVEVAADKGAAEIAAEAHVAASAAHAAFIAAKQASLQADAEVAATSEVYRKAIMAYRAASLAAARARKALQVQ